MSEFYDWAFCQCLHTKCFCLQIFTFCFASASTRSALYLWACGFFCVQPRVFVAFFRVIRVAVFSRYAARVNISPLKYAWSRDLTLLLLLAAPLHNTIALYLAALQTGFTPIWHTAQHTQLSRILYFTACHWKWARSWLITRQIRYTEW